MDSNIKHLSTLTNDLLSIARIDEGKIEMIMKEERLNDIFTDISSSYETIFKENNLKFIVTIPNNLPSIFIESSKIREVIENIISNSLKYITNTKKIITVFAQEKKRFVEVRMTDNGKGVERAYLNKLFDEFYKTDTARHGSSSGLGLSICQTIIDNHDGKMVVESVYGEFTKIIIDLPVKK